MDDAHLKPRSSRARPSNSIRVTLRDSPDHGIPAVQPSLMPWTQVADLWLHHVGFAPGQRMRISFDYRNARLTISPNVE
jgi:hypothetical protein